MWKHAFYNFPKNCVLYLVRTYKLKKAPYQESEDLRSSQSKIHRILGHLHYYKTEVLCRPPLMQAAPNVHRRIQGYLGLPLGSQWTRRKIYFAELIRWKSSDALNMRKRICHLSHCQVHCSYASDGCHAECLLRYHGFSPLSECDASICRAAELADGLLYSGSRRSRQRY
jgi:hypothetical protein